MFFDFVDKVWIFPFVKVHTHKPSHQLRKSNLSLCSIDTLMYFSILVTRRNVVNKSVRKLQMHSSHLSIYVPIIRFSRLEHHRTRHISTDNRPLARQEQWVKKMNRKEWKWDNILLFGDIFWESKNNEIIRKTQPVYPRYRIRISKYRYPILRMIDILLGIFFKFFGDFLFWKLFFADRNESGSHRKRRLYELYNLVWGGWGNVLGSVIGYPILVKWDIIDTQYEWTLSKTWNIRNGSVEEWKCDFRFSTFSEICHWEYWNFWCSDFCRKCLHLLYIVRPDHKIYTITILSLPSKNQLKSKSHIAVVVDDRDEEIDYGSFGLLSSWGVWHIGILLSFRIQWGIC